MSITIFWRLVLGKNWLCRHCPQPTVKNSTFPSSPLKICATDNSCFCRGALANCSDISKVHFSNFWLSWNQHAVRVNLKTVVFLLNWSFWGPFCHNALQCIWFDNLGLIWNQQQAGESGEGWRTSGRRWGGKSWSWCWSWCARKFYVDVEKAMERRVLEN